MPIVHVHVAEGRSPDLLAKMAVAVTQAIADTLAVPPETVRVLLDEVPKRHWLVGGVTLDEVQARRAREGKR